MSVAFTAEGRSNPNTQSVQALLDENSQLIQAIVDYQNKGKAYESTRYQQLLHRNLVYLATLADSSQPNPGSQGPSQGGVLSKPVNSVSPPVHPQGPAPVPGTMMGGDSSNMPKSSNDPMLSSSQSYPGMAAPASGNYGSGNMPGTSPPPQLQHPPVSGPNVAMGYQSPSNQQVRSQGPPVIGRGMQNMNQQAMSRHPSQLPQQHMIAQGQQTQQQQYLIQQRQMSYRQPSSQQVPTQQQPISASNPTNYNQQQSSGMMPAYPQQQKQQQQQQQRYNPYRPPPQQQTLSHMPYPQQQSQMVMGQSQLGRTGQMPMAQSAMGPSMSQSPMGQPPV